MGQSSLYPLQEAFRTIAADMRRCSQASCVGSMCCTQTTRDSQVLLAWPALLRVAMRVHCGTASPRRQGNVGPAPRARKCHTHSDRTSVM
jgi:hypothetical protein